ncbi:MAG TPA: ATPase, T2SS/T4P/T4SS family [Elusimicrobiota bacterium]|nr:ATPase, T2SS/T4P/T4SS family [Elusimicrobiota bacterium]
MKKKLGDILVDVGIITREQLDQAIEIQRAKGGKLGDILKEMNFCSEDVLLAFLGRQCGVSYISLAEYGDIPQDVINMVPESVARHQTLIPIARDGNVLTIAMSDPLNVFATDDLKLMTGCDIKVVIASEKEIKQSIDRHYLQTSSVGVATSNVEEGSVQNYKPGEMPASMKDVVQKIEKDTPVEIETVTPVAGADVFTVNVEADEAPVIKMVNVLLANAAKAGASDIHIEPYENVFRIRYRIDGVLHNQPAPPRKYQNAIISRVKVMAQMDVAERRLPQDGRIKIKIEGKEIDLRVSTAPTAHGEKVVMRLLDSSGIKVDLTDLGFDPEPLILFKKIISSPHGMILVTGPTGSGKSTTLYATLSALNRSDINILTIEDPIEYKIEGINQVQARADIGLTFAVGLRNFLRQDPDIILVGEIRDKETAEIAINAALTGHLVLSTLHTNDAPGAITRLDNMGVESFLTVSTLLAVVGQRLIRVICDHCKETSSQSVEHLSSVGINLPHTKISSRGKSVTLSRGKGCDHCAGTGYHGRMAIYELMPVTDPIRELILARASGHQIKQVARRQGMLTLREAAVQKMMTGITTLEEVLRVTQSDADAETESKR